ncbi:MAG TPA: MFS transporter [Pseudonocardiaceae bacterium]
MVGSRRPGFGPALAVGEFRALWTAEAQSVVGDQLAKVALTVLVFQRTGSAGLAALSFAALLLPALVAGPLLSWIADVLPRRPVMVGCALTQAVLVGVMAVPGTPLWALFALIVTVQLVQAPFAAAQAALLPVILSGEPYQAAQALRQITRQVGMLAGLGFGGIAVATLGVSTALLVDAVTFLLAALVIRLGVASRPAAAPRGPVDPDGATHGATDGATDDGAGFLGGLGLVWHDRRLRSLVALAWLAGFAVVPEGLAAPFAASAGAGPSAVGWLLAVDPAAMAVGAYVMVRFVDQDTRLRLLGPLAVLTVLPLLGYAAGPGLTTALVLLALSGLFAAYQVTASATFMELVPDARRGQAYGVARSGLVAAQGLGVAAGGLVAELTGSVSWTIALAGAAGLLVAVPAAVGWRRASTRHPELSVSGAS